MRRLMTLMATAALVGGACGGDDDSSSDSSPAKPTTTVDTSTKIQKALEACIELTGISTAETLDVRSRVGDEGATITFDTRGEEEFSGDSLLLVACVLDELEVTDFVTAQIDSTRALDGQKSGEWGDFQAVWSYHPDSGLTLTINEK